MQYLTAALVSGAYFFNEVDTIAGVGDSQVLLSYNNIFISDSMGFTVYADDAATLFSNSLECPHIVATIATDLVLQICNKANVQAMYIFWE